MVQNKLTEQDVLKNAEGLSFPKSVVEYFQGLIGFPQGGFPEPLRTHVLKGAPTVDGRPGASMAPLDLEELASQLIEEYPSLAPEISETDLMSAAMYPKVCDLPDFHLTRDV